MRRPLVHTTVTRVHTKTAIGQADLVYSECWLGLCAFKAGKLTRENPSQLFTFQPRLAEALLNLSTHHGAIVRRREQLLEKRTRYQPAWFAARMRALAEQLELVDDTIKLGKALGDAFAWFFYQKDRHYIHEHLAKPEQFYFPTGIGGIGELQFIKNTPVLNGHFVVFHGITNFLRLGDFSLVSLKKLQVVAIGELKSKGGSDENSVLVQAFISSPASTEYLLQPAIAFEDTAALAVPLLPMHERKRRKLNRQLGQIQNSFAALSNQVDKSISLKSELSVDSLGKLLRNVRRRRLTFAHPTPGLMLSAYREPCSKTLYGSLISQRTNKVMPTFDGIETRVNRELMLEGEMNSLLIGSFFYDKVGKTAHIPGMTHLFWWPISDKVIHAIIFRRVTIFTLLNPAHAIASLKKKGYEVTSTGAEKYVVRIQDADNEIRFEGLGHCLRMTQQNLLPFQSIVDVIDAATKNVLADTCKEFKEISIRIDQTFGSLPQG